MRLILICQQCSTETEAGDMKDGHCLACQIEAAAGPARKELIRLRNKRARYAAKGISPLSIDQQVERVVLRVRGIIEGLTKDARKVQQHLGALLQSTMAENQPTGLERLLIH